MRELMRIGHSSPRAAMIYQHAVRERDQVAGWFPQLADTKLRQTTWPQIAEHHEYITAQLKAGVRQATIHRRLRDEHGLAASVASLKRYVAANLPEEVRRDRWLLRDEADTPPGEEAQIDYGHLGYWIDPVSGKRRRVRAFGMVLACSRHRWTRFRAASVGYGQSLPTAGESG